MYKEDGYRMALQTYYECEVSCRRKTRVQDNDFRWRPTCVETFNKDNILSKRVADAKRRIIQEADNPHFGSLLSQPSR
jgi:hypothetical protein